MDKTFQVNDRVVWVERSNLKSHNEYEDDDCTRGVVKAVGEGGLVTVKWDSKWMEPRTQSIHSNKLISEAEANQILSKLEAEYEAWAGPIKAKIKEAAKLLDEAGDLADDQNRNLAEMHEVVGPLIRSMDNLGWRTSSLSC